MEAFKNPVNFLVDRFSKMKTHRSSWEHHWQEIRHLVRTNTSDFNANSTRGDRRTENIYDGTAPWALEQFSSGLHGHLTSPTERWFNIDVKGFDATDDAEVLTWLESVSDSIYFEYGKAESNINPAMHEAYLDLGAFGTCILFQDYDQLGQHLVFRSFPLSDCFIQENANGVIDTVFRRSTMTFRQLAQKFDSIPEKITRQGDIDKEYEIIHAVYPRSDRNPQKADKLNMPFKSCWFSEEYKHIFLESGYTEFPYHAPRWSKLAGEIYGRSPAMTCLPDIKMINQMSKIVIKAAQKVVDPPLMVPDDGFMLPLKTAPSSLIFYQQGSDPIVPLESRGRIDIGLELMDQRRDHIIKSFFVDWILQQKNNVEMTATEVMDRREEKLRMMAPMIGRIESELLNPMIRRTFSLLTKQGLLPPPPDSLSGMTLDITYSSPATQAQAGIKAVSMQRYLQDLIPLAEISPDIMDSINTDEFAKLMADIRDVSRKIIRSPDEVAQIREGRQQQEQQAQMAEQAPALSGSVKDLAQAQQMGGLGMPNV